MTDVTKSTQCRAHRFGSMTATASIVIILHAHGSAVLAQTVEQVQAMRVHIEQSGLEGFREAAAANGWGAPVIPSKWHLENKTPSEDVPLGQAARDLGLALVRKTDTWAGLMLTESGQPLLDRASRLVDLAEWLGSAEGYGNFFAAGHACDVALTGLARLVADLGFSLPGVKAQVERCNLPIISPPAVARILNQEVGDQVFPPSADSLEAIGRIHRARGGRAEIPNLSPKDRQDGVVRLMKLELVALGLDPDVPEPHAAFFQDDRCERPTTTELCWDRKRHSSIVAGPWLLEGLRGLGRLITFRDAVGGFPTVPAAPNRMFSPTEQAFREAWRPHAAPGTEKYGTTAGVTYELILAGRFVDADTSQRRLGPEFMTPAPSPAPTAGTPTP